MKKDILQQNASFFELKIVSIFSETQKFAGKKSII